MASPELARMTFPENHVFRCGLTRKRGDLTDLEFEQHWRTVHAPLALKIPGVIAYSQNTILRQWTLDHDDVDRDLQGISMLGFANHSDMKKSGDSAEHHACIADVANFLSDASLLVMTSPAINRTQFRKKPKVIALFSEGRDPQTFFEYVTEIDKEILPSVNTLRTEAVDHQVDDPSVTEMRRSVCAMTELYFNSSPELERFWKAASCAQYQIAPSAMFETCETIQR